MNSYLDSLSVGNDPRVFQPFLDLKEELDKRFHPARPDIDWQRVHDLCISLFNQNGIDLQTAAWYVLCRQHQAGLNGLNEGLSLLDKILTQYWQTLWPTQTHTRVNILSTLSQQLVSGIRKTEFVYADLSLLYESEALLKKINRYLETLELKHLVQFEYLQNLIITQTRQLENADTLDTDFNVSLSVPSPNKKTKPQEKSTKEKNAQPLELKENVLSLSPQTYSAASISLSSPETKPHYSGFWQGVISGILFCGLLFSIAFYFILSEFKTEKLSDVLPYIPSFNTQTGVVIDKQLIYDKAHPKAIDIKQLEMIQFRLDDLSTLSPIWAQHYGLNITQYLVDQYGDNPNVISLSQNWENNLHINASTEDNLKQWSEGMAQLDALSQRLDSFDGNPKNYITGSELKSIIFKARQHFNQAKPLEEELRLLETKPASSAIPDSEYQQIDNHFRQLLNKYALLRDHS